MFNILKDGYKLFLDKDCKSETLRHEYYQVTEENNHYFYHLRYSHSLKNLDEETRVRDYDVVTCNNEDYEKILQSTVDDIIHNYLEYNGYSVSCNKKPEVNK
jgi:sulfur transfer protein SufE